MKTHHKNKLLVLNFLAIDTCFLGNPSPGSVLVVLRVFHSSNFLISVLLSIFLAPGFENQQLKLYKVSLDQ